MFRCQRLLPYYVSASSLLANSLVGLVADSETGGKGASILCPVVNPPKEAGERPDASSNWFIKCCVVGSFLISGGNVQNWRKMLPSFSTKPAMSFCLLETSTFTFIFTFLNSSFKILRVCLLPFWSNLCFSSSSYTASSPGILPLNTSSHCRFAARLRGTLRKTYSISSEESSERNSFPLTISLTMCGIIQSCIISSRNLSNFPAILSCGFLPSNTTLSCNLNGVPAGGCFPKSESLTPASFCACASNSCVLLSNN